MAETAKDNSDILEDLLTSAGESLQKKFVIPTYKGASTKAAEAEVAKARTSRDELGRTVDESKATFKEATGSLKGGIDAEAKAKSDKANADQIQAQEIADAHRMTNQLFGVGVNSSDAIAVLATENRTKVKPQLDADLAKVAELSSVGPLDNPLEWLFNGLQLPSAQQKYNATATQYNTNQETIDKGIANSTAMGMQLTKSIPTITAAQAKATADEAVAQSIKLKAVADQNFAIHSVDMTNKKLAGDLAIAGDTIRMTQLQIEQSKAKYQSEIDGIRLQETHTQRLLQAAQVYEKLDDINKQKVVLANAEDKLGYTRGTLSPAGMKMMKKEQQDAIYAIGLTDSFGVTPLDAWETAKNLKLGPGVSEDTVKVINYLDGKLGGLKKTLMETEQFKRLSKDEQRASVSGGLRAAIALDMQEADKPGNFFHELSPAKIMMADKDFTNSPLGKVLQPLAAKDQETMTKDVVATALEGFDKNPSIAGPAIAEYYKKNIELRNKTIPYKGAGGIDIPTTYFVSFNGSRYDMTKPGDATKYTLEVAKQATMAKMSKDFGVNF